MENLKYISVKKIEGNRVTIHCVQSPEDGELVNAQIVETASKVLLIDTLQLVPHANELRSYIESIGKPLDRIIISHHHPDHWFGAASFKDYPIYAFPEAIGILGSIADYLLGYHRTLHPQNPEVIPAEKVLPTEVLQEGMLEFDGVELTIRKVFDTECPVNLLVDIQDEKILLAQDIVYNQAYPYFGDRTSTGDYCFDNWIALLTILEAQNYSHVIPGHGDPTDPAVFKAMTEYLQYVKVKVAEGLRDEALIQSIKEAYPDYRLELTLHMSNYMLFKFQNQELTA